MSRVIFFLLFILLSGIGIAQTNCITTQKRDTLINYDEQVGLELIVQYGYKEIICDERDTSYLLHGYYNVLTLDEQPYQILYFENDKIKGQSLDYYTNGNLKMISTYRNDTLFEINAIYSKTNALLDTNILMNGVGKFNYYDDESRLLSQSYIEYNLRNGYVIFYDTLGTKIGEENYVNDIKNGACNFYYDNGNVKSSSTFDDGILVGPYLEYYETGELKSKSIYKQPPFNYQDSVELRLIQRSENDILNLLDLFDPGEYQKGVLVGKKLEYDKNGKLID